LLTGDQYDDVLVGVLVGVAIVAAVDDVDVDQEKALIV